MSQIEIAQSDLAIAEDKLARMVSLSSTFQAGDTPAAAALRVHQKNILGTNKPRPHAIASQGDLHTLELIGGGSQNWFRASGDLQLYMARDTDPEFYNDEVQAERAAANFFGLVVTDIANLANKDDPGSPFGESHLAIVRLSRIHFDEVAEQHWESAGRFYFAVYNVAWGDG